MRPWDWHGSYAINDWLARPQAYAAAKANHWWRADVKGASNIPVMVDSAWRWAWTCVAYSGPDPPECDAIPTTRVREYPGFNPSCINRHDGYVNGLFLDWSVRKVGLKELWTLKWWPKFNTAGPWTKAGGVQPEDWPQWMRRFKDY